MVFPGDPVNGRVKMGAGMLSAGKIVPVPGWAAVVVFGNFFQMEGPRFSKLWRKLNDSRACVQRLAEIDHPDLSGGKSVRKLS
jgi:hypothetical protein